jgi:exodeoxyribonuclease VII small subunit
LDTTESPDFEKCLERLEAIVREIEGGNLNLDTAMARFTEGMELVKTCRALLAGAEQKLYVLIEGESSEPHLIPTSLKKENTNGF